MAPASWRATDVTPLDDETLAQLDGWWRAANYLSVGQIYLLNNPLLRTPLTRDDVKPRLLGHWGTTPGLNFIYAHLNRAIKARRQSTIYLTGPGHGGPGLVASAYLDDAYSEVYSDITQDTEGIRRMFRQFSFPGGIPSHVAPETPGSIHEGGELGYALSHAYGAAFDNPDLLVVAIVGDGEAETGALATSWHSNQFVNPAQDGAVLPILHLNGYKIANPTELARIPEAELRGLMIGFGHNPYFFEVPDEGDDAADNPADAHRRFATLLDEVLDEITEIKAGAAAGDIDRPAWPMIVFRTPKGWTGPGYIDGKKTTGSWRAHQVPLANARDTPEHLKVLADWLASYKPEELFDEDGKIDPTIAALAPEGTLRMSDNPHANGGLLTRDLRLPDFREYGVDVVTPGTPLTEAPRLLGQWLTDVIRLNPDNFRIFGPDETASNRLQAVFDVTGKQWIAEFNGPGHHNLHVRGYKEVGTTTTPFDMVMLNDLDRFHLVMDVIDRVPFLQSKAATLRQRMYDKRLEAREYTRAYGDDLPEVRDWVWPASRRGRDRAGQRHRVDGWRQRVAPPTRTAARIAARLGVVDMPLIRTAHPNRLQGR
ncbi:MAG TPA: hypothetical protein VIW24_28570 [Aldersonia sp.]